MFLARPSNFPASITCHSEEHSDEEPGVGPIP